MAEAVEVPIRLTVEDVVDIDTSDVSSKILGNFSSISAEVQSIIRDMSSDITKAMQGVSANNLSAEFLNLQASIDTFAQTTTDKFSNVGTAVNTVNTALTNARSSIEKQIANLEKYKRIFSGDDGNEYTAQQLDNINTRIQALKNELATLDISKIISPELMEKMANEVRDTTIQLEKYQTMWEKMKATEPGLTNKSGKEEKPQKTQYTDDYKDLNKELNSAITKMKSLAEKSAEMEKFGAKPEKWEKLNWQADRLKTRVGEIVALMMEMAQSGDAFKLGGNSEEELDRIIKLFDKFDESVNNIGKQAPTKLQTVTSALQKIQNACKKVVSGLGKIISRIGSLGKSSKKSSGSINKSLNKVWKNFMMFVLGFRSMYYLIKKLRQVITQEFGYMAMQITEVNTYLSSLKKNANQMKGSLAGAAEPILTVLVPAFQSLTNVVMKATNALGNFMATLTGQGYFYEFTASAVDYAESLETAKEKQKDLMDFDEINRLSDKSSSSSSDKSGGTWSKKTIDSASTLAELMKEGWAKGDFSEVGEYIAQTLTKALDDATKKINGPFKEKAEKIANVFATFLNGVFGSDGFAVSIGNTIAAGINTAISAIDTFLTATNFSDIGKFIQDGITTAISNIDFENIGKTIGDALLAAVNFAFSLLVGFDYEAVGGKLAEGINKIFAVMGTADEDGYTGWQKVGMALSSGVDGILTGIISALYNVDWSQLGTAIGQFIASIDWDAVTWDFVELAGAIISGIAEALLGWGSENPISLAIASLFTAGMIAPNVISAISTLISLFGKLDAIKTTVWSGLYAMFQGLKAGFGEAISMIKGPLITAFTSLKSFLSTFATPLLGVFSIIFGFFTALDSFVTMLSEGFSWLKEIIMVLGIALVALGAIVLGAPALAAGVIAAIVAAVTTAVVLIKEHWTQIKEFFVFMVNDMKTRWTNFWTGARNTVASVGNSISTAFNTVCTNLKNAFNSVKTFFKNVVNGIIGVINGMLSSIASAINKIGSIVSKASVNVPSWVPGLGGKKLGFSIGTVYAPQIPYLAQGAVIPPNKEFLAMLGDQKKGVNIETPLDTMLEAFTKALDSRGLNESIEIKVPVTLDGKKLYEAIAVVNNDQVRRTGSSKLLV